MTTTLTTQNPIDEGGKIEVDFSDDIDATAPDGCYTIPLHHVCTRPSAKKIVITITGSPDTDGDGNADGVAAGSFTFYTLNTFSAASSTASISTAVSYLSSGERIDQLAAAVTINTANATVTKMTSLDFQGGDDTANNGSLTAAGDSTGQLYVAIWALANVKGASTFSSTSVTLHFPFSTSAKQYLGYYIPSGTF